MARILVVDDEKAIRDLVCEALAYYGHDVVEASGGDEALWRTALSTFDFVLLDLMMPQMTGLDVIESLKRRLVAPPVVIMTAALDFAPSGYPVLSKPFSISELLAVTEEYGVAYSRGESAPCATGCLL